MIRYGISALERYNNSINWYIAFEIIFIKGEQKTNPHSAFQNAATISLTEEEIKRTVINSFSKCDNDIENFTHNGSGWRFIGLDRVVVSVYGYNLANGRIYIPTPTVLSSKKAIVNVQILVNRCFMWRILAALYLPQENSQRVMKYQDHVAKLNFEMLTFLLNIHVHRSFYQYIQV